MQFYFKNLIHISKPQRDRGLGNPYIAYEYFLSEPVLSTISSPVSTTVETYTTSEVAGILHVSDQTIRRMCDAGKFPGASRTDGGHWRIPKEHFKVTPEQSKQIDKDVAAIRSKSDEGGQVDEFDL